ncbi:MAG: integrin alpha [Planctomycetota bacterium]
MHGGLIAPASRWVRTKKRRPAKPRPPAGHQPGPRTLRARQPQPIMSIKLLLVCSPLLVGALPAQVMNLNPFPGFGDETCIAGDLLSGGGQRDVLFSDTGNSSTVAGSVGVWFTEGASFTIINDPQAFPPALFGRALANVGFVDGDAVEDFAVGAPGSGRVYIYSGSTLAVIRTITGGAGVNFGWSIVNVGNVNGVAGNEIAVGSPGSNTVSVCDCTTGAILYSFASTALGQFGTSLAASGNTLAVGAPFNTNLAGYVRVFSLGSTSATSLATLVRGVSNERFGFSVAAIGDLTGDSNTEFAVLAPGARTVHVFNRVTPTVAMSSFNYGTGATQLGRVAALGDVDGDGRGDFAATDNQNLRIFTTPTNSTLSVIAQMSGSSTTGFTGGIATGPDVRGMGTTDLITARMNATPLQSEIQVSPLASHLSLPNPPTLQLRPNSVRPTLGSTFQLTATDNSGTGFIFLLGDLAPRTPVSFGNGTAFVTAGTAVTLNAGASPLVTNVTIPTTVSSLYVGLIFQALVIPASGPWIVSNGILSRAGSF